MTREFLNEGVSRSGLSRCLSRQGGSHLQALLPGGRAVNVYNHPMPQRALGHVCPVAALEQWQLKRLSFSLLRLIIPRGLT